MADTKTAIVGKECKLYYSDDYGTPVWAEIDKAINVSHPTLGKTMNSIASREIGWNSAVPGMKSIALNFGYLYEKGSDSVLDDLRDSFLNDTVLTFAAMDGDITTSGSQGWRIPGIVSAMTETQDLEGNITIDVTVDFVRIRESGNIVEPDWYEVAGS
jgi:hypothetical protein